MVPWKKPLIFKQYSSMMLNGLFWKVTLMEEPSTNLSDDDIQVTLKMPYELVDLRPETRVKEEESQEVFSLVQ